MAPSHYEAFSLGPPRGGGRAAAADRDPGFRFRRAARAWRQRRAGGSHRPRVMEGLRHFMRLDETGRASMGQAARASVEALGPERFAGAWADLYASLADAAAPATLSSRPLSDPCGYPLPPSQEQADAQGSVATNPSGAPDRAHPPQSAVAGCPGIWVIPSQGRVGPHHPPAIRLRGAEGSRPCTRGGLSSVSVIEVGVASGAGVMNMAKIARQASRETGVAIEIHGFDTGAGCRPQSTTGTTPTSTPRVISRWIRKVSTAYFLQR